MSVQRFLFNIPSDEIEQTAGFYQELFGFEIIFHNEDWYILVVSQFNSEGSWDTNAATSLVPAPK